MAGRNAPKLSSFTVKLPAGLSYVRRRVHGVLKLLGLSLTGARLKSAVLQHGQLVVTLHGPVDNLIFSLSDRALRERRNLRSRAGHGKLKSLRLTVIVRDAAGRSTTRTLVLR